MVDFDAMTDPQFAAHPDTPGKRDYIASVYRRATAQERQGGVTVVTETYGCIWSEDCDYETPDWDDAMEHSFTHPAALNGEV